MKAVLIPGDGIGREIAESVRAVSAALNTGIEWQKCEAGAEYAEASGELIAPGTLDAIEACGWALKGPTATPIGKGFRSINVQLRQRFATYANLRPVHTLPGVPTRFENVDLVIVRENTEDLYKGIEYMLTDDIANGVKLITRPACEKICRFAFDYARKNGCICLRIDTNEKNENARRLYAKLGYREAGIVPCVFNGIPGVNLVCLEKKL